MSNGFSVEWRDDRVVIGMRGDCRVETEYLGEGGKATHDEIERLLATVRVRQRNVVLNTLDDAEAMRDALTAFIAFHRARQPAAATG